MDREGDRGPVAVDLNVDSALLLQRLVGIDRYPANLMLMPTVFDDGEQARVDEYVSRQLTDAGILADGVPLPRIAHWLHCLARPDVELTGEVTDARADPHDDKSTLRMALARSGDTHVLALRHGDAVVLQELDAGERPVQAVAAAFAACFGPAPARRFESWSMPAAAFDTLPAGSPERFRRALLALGAGHRTAGALATLRTAATRSGGVVMTEHHDGNATRTAGWVGVFDSPHGRTVLAPVRRADGELWCTFLPGDMPALEFALTRLSLLLPSGTWC
ncbi:MAG: ESX secretion-associated protein EspG [Mycobacteriaceae bacterium]|nr:ESX secretion-associated protein EspG [Mycobacteriaceae bacterium]